MASLPDVFSSGIISLAILAKLQTPPPPMSQASHFVEMDLIQKNFGTALILRSSLQVKSHPLLSVLLPLLSPHLPPTHHTHHQHQQGLAHLLSTPIAAKGMLHASVIGPGQRIQRVVFLGIRPPIVNSIMNVLRRKDGTDLAEQG
jgi:hypothetical protein